MTCRWTTALAVALALVAPGALRICASETPDKPVRAAGFWIGDDSIAIARARQTGKPLFYLFR